MLKILHFSPHNENCGIGKYQENYLKAMENSAEVENVFFNFSPYKTRGMNAREFDEIMEKLRVQLARFDILHIQHEFGFFRGKQLEKLIKTAKKAGKKVVVSFHTSPDLIIIRKPLAGFGIHSVVAFLRTRRHNNLLKKVHIKPLIFADAVLAHNSYTKKQLASFGVPESKIQIIPHPTYEITNPPKTRFVAEKLVKKSGDIILGTIGYLHRFKGVDKAVKSLQYLPENYKLAVLGGVKSDSNDWKIYDKIADLVVKLNLKDRVFISGVVPRDEDLNSYIREIDFCLFPYDSTYYKGVGSGALNLAIANEKPIVAYPVPTFIETNEPFGQITFTDSDSYYELAREISRIDISAQTEKIIKYAKSNSFEKMSQKLIKIYKNL